MSSSKGFMEALNDVLGKAETSQQFVASLRGFLGTNTSLGVRNSPLDTSINAPHNGLSILADAQSSNMAYDAAIEMASERFGTDDVLQKGLKTERQSFNLAVSQRLVHYAKDMTYQSSSRTHTNGDVQTIENPKVEAFKFIGNTLQTAKGEDGYLAALESYQRANDPNVGYSDLASVRSNAGKNLAALEQTFNKDMIDVCISDAKRQVDPMFKVPTEEIAASRAMADTMKQLGNNSEMQMHVASNLPVNQIADTEQLTAREKVDQLEYAKTYSTHSYDANSAAKTHEPDVQPVEPQSVSAGSAWTMPEYNEMAVEERLKDTGDKAGDIDSQIAMMDRQALENEIDAAMLELDREEQTQSYDR